MNIIFTGPPLAGKGTQAKLLSEKLGIPVLSIGALLREAWEKGDPVATKGYEEYAMKGKYLPIDLKFYLLKEKLDSLGNGFILENFPSTQEDLDTFLPYLESKGWSIDKVFDIAVPKEEIYKRMQQRGRVDDKKEIVDQRREYQEQDREAVTDYFQNQGILINIDGQGSVEEVFNRVMQNI